MLARFGLLAPVVAALACRAPPSSPPREPDPVVEQKDDPSAAPVPRARLEIRFDYRFDDGYFSDHPERRRTLEAAAAIWSDLLEVDFPEVPAEHVPRLSVRDDGHHYRGTVAETRGGTPCERWTGPTATAEGATPSDYPDAGLGDHAYCRNPDHRLAPYCYTADGVGDYCSIPGLGSDSSPSLDAANVEPDAVDDIIVFVYARGGMDYPAIAGPRYSLPEGGDGLPDALAERYHGEVFRPWEGFFSVNTRYRQPFFFDQTPETVDDIPVGHADFLSVALHELGHVLGIVGGAEPFQRHVRDGSFHGPATTAINGGEPLPLHQASGLDAGHIHASHGRGRLRPSIEADLMSLAQLRWYRQYPSRLDAAILEDLGYVINEEAMATLHPPGAKSSSPYRDPTDDPRRAPDAWTLDAGAPIGFWAFDDPAHLNGAIQGSPTLYQPPEFGLVRDTVIDGGIRVPSEGLLYVEHDRTTGNCAGDSLNCWSLVLDVRIDSLARRYALFNAHPANDDPADGWIVGGRVGGEGFSTEAVIEPGVWHRITVTVDLERAAVRYYVDGKLAHSEPAVPVIDGSMALRVGTNFDYFVLFADHLDRTSAIDVRQAVLYDRPLTAEQAAALGTAEDHRPR